MQGGRDWPVVTRADGDIMSLRGTVISYERVDVRENGSFILLDWQGTTVPTTVDRRNAPNTVCSSSPGSWLT